MRNEGIRKFLSMCTLVCALIVVLNAVALHVVRIQYAPGTSKTSLFNITSQIHEWGDYFLKWKSLAQENKDLMERSRAAIANEALVESLQTENETLRKAAGLAVAVKRQLTPAGIFSVSLDASGYHALINKGQKDGILVGEAVVSSDSSLIGKISGVFPSSSVVMLVSDPNFSVTVRVMNGQASGILRGALREGLTLDLITQSDQITEGDILTTTGSDLIPAGLIAGTVRNVQNNDTQLFKNVKVQPAMEQNYGGTVMVVHQ
jgi:rod shape-determining protein MreC